MPTTKTAERALIILQRLSHEVGWGYKDVVDRLEEKRKIKAQAFHERKVRQRVHLDITCHIDSLPQLAAAKLRQKAHSDNASSFEKLTALGY